MLGPQRSPGVLGRGRGPLGHEAMDANASIKSSGGAQAGAPRAPVGRGVAARKDVSTSSARLALHKAGSETTSTTALPVGNAPVPRVGLAAGRLLLPNPGSLLLDGKLSPLRSPLLSQRRPRRGGSPSRIRRPPPLSPNPVDALGRSWRRPNHGPGVARRPCWPMPNPALPRRKPAPKHTSLLACGSIPPKTSLMASRPSLPPCARSASACCRKLLNSAMGVNESGRVAVAACSRDRTSAQAAIDALLRAVSGGSGAATHVGGPAATKGPPAGPDPEL